MAAALAGCEGSVLEPHGPIALAESSILIDATFIMLAIIVPAIAATLGFAWWFRASNTKAFYRPGWAYSGRVELLIWSVPLLTIIFLGGIAWIGAHRLDPSVPIASDNKRLEIQVVSLDWKWLFIYPEQNVGAVNQLVIPANTPVRFTLTSASVWNSFFVPQLGSQIYTMKGMATRLFLMADREGTFYGESTHFSGDGFSKMHFPVTSVSSEVFLAWIKQAQASSRTLDAEQYEMLAKQSIADKPSTYRASEPGLFDKIVSGVLAAGSGPRGGAAPDVTPKGGT